MSEWKSDSIAALAEALAKAQGQMEYAAREGTNPFFKRDGKASTYATLASTWAACRAALSDHGLSVVQSPGDVTWVEGRAVLVVATTLLHSSGEWIREVASLPVSKDDAQGVVAATTYARRNALAAFVGVAPEDDDGEEAVGRGPSGEDIMPMCSVSGCKSRARYSDDLGRDVCGIHRPNKPPPAPRNPANGKEAMGEKMVAQERWRKAIQAAVDVKILDSIYANPSAEYGQARKVLLGQTLEMPETWAQQLQLTNVTIEQWTEAADRLFVRVQEATA